MSGHVAVPEHSVAPPVVRWGCVVSATITATIVVLGWREISKMVVVLLAIVVVTTLLLEVWLHWLLVLLTVITSTKASSTCEPKEQ